MVRDVSRVLEGPGPRGWRRSECLCGKHGKGDLRVAASRLANPRPKDVASRWSLASTRSGGISGPIPHGHPNWAKSRCRPAPAGRRPFAAAPPPGVRRAQKPADSLSVTA